VIGSAVLLPLVLLRKRRAGTGIFSRNDLRAGAACGFFLAVASNLQQAGIMTTDVGKAGFLTAMYIVIVPVLHFFLTRRSSLRLWISAAIAAAGLYFLSISGSWTLETGDILLILCAFVFSLHILCIDHFSGTSDGVTVSCLQFLTAAVLSWAGALLTETVLWDTIRQAGPAILYAGVFSCGVAYTLQIIGQKGADPGPASLILSLESVVSVAAGFLYLGQALTARELLGCALMFAAIVLVQLPEKK
jgi:drug/metabolite transporter (DMT)-like permease